MTTPCPNCCWETVEDHPTNGCVLAALIGVLRDREYLTEQELRHLHANCNVDALWDDLQAILHMLEDGAYNLTEDDV